MYSKYWWTVAVEEDTMCNFWDLSAARISCERGTEGEIMNDESSSDDPMDYLKPEKVPLLDKKVAPAPSGILVQVY